MNDVINNHYLYGKSSPKGAQRVIRKDLIIMTRFHPESILEAKWKKLPMIMKIFSSSDILSSKKNYPFWRVSQECNFLKGHLQNLPDMSTVSDKFCCHQITRVYPGIVIGCGRGGKSDLFFWILTLFLGWSVSSACIWCVNLVRAW